MRQRCILDYAAKLTLHPAKMEKADVRRLCEAGLDDGEILDVCQVTAYYNYVNRLADGLGVELEERPPITEGRGGKRGGE